MSTFLYTLFLIGAGYFVRYMQDERRYHSNYQRGYYEGMKDTQAEYDDAETPRDKAEVSLGEEQP
jgi:hypothetical protein